MDLRTLHRRSLFFHWRTNLAVTLGVTVAAAVLTGALVVGDSMQGSLREAALGRLGSVDHALVSNRFFREALASNLASAEGAERHLTQACPLILLSGAATHAESHARVNRITVIGADDRFWRLKSEGSNLAVSATTGRSVVINEPLARELGAGVGDELLIRVGKPAATSPEMLFGRRDDAASTLRLTVRNVIPAEGLGAFSLQPRQFLPRNAYIPLSTLQRVLDRRGRVNAILVAGSAAEDPASNDEVDALDSLLQSQVTMADLGLRFRVDEQRAYLSLESEAMLLEPAIESLGRKIAGPDGRQTSTILTYLANSMTAEASTGTSTSKARDDGSLLPSRTVIPYSTVTALDPSQPAYQPLVLINGDPAPALKPGEILLNEWAANDLQARPGDRIALSYYVTGPFGRLETRTTTFLLRAVVALNDVAADPGFTPEYRGVTDAESIADWDPPFPVDLDLIRDKDEAYWDRYRTTPKAFITLIDGLRLWAEDADRFGQATSLRIHPAPGSETMVESAASFERIFLEGLDVRHVGFTFEPVREQLRSAGAGTTDFGMLFIGFSFFLIISAAMLVALLFRLGVERRSSEVGLLLAVGFSPRSVTRLLVAQGAVLAGIGGPVGLLVAFLYAWFMLAGLRSWWSDAVNAPFLRLHISPVSLAVGLVASLLVAVLAIAWSVRGLTRLSARSLLAGAVAAGRTEVVARTGAGRRSGSRATITAGVAFVVAAIFVVLPVTSDAMPEAAAFFISGAAMLVGCLAFLARRLAVEGRHIIQRPGGPAFLRLGIRNACRQRGRSILTAGLIASATFLVAAIGAFRLAVDPDDQGRQSATGGFALFAESAVSLLHDLNTHKGREALSVAPAASAALDDVEIIPFRLRPGDESSCLNLYRPTRPRILGATDAMVQRGGFVFSSTLAESQRERDNPWTLLERRLPDGAIPVMADEATVKWQFHLGLGKDLVVTDELGRDVRLRFVALLSGSVLQDELIVAEADFVRLFPSTSGYGFFLIDAPPAAGTEVEQVLERELAAFGFDAGSTRARLAEYHMVQNTYLSTFQTLGGFGLILGTVGLAAVLLRNVWERRGELALMRALGFSRAAIGWIVLIENVALLVAGLLAGVLSAALAIAPHIVNRPESIPWLSLSLTLTAVLATGIAAGLVAVIPALRTPLLPALRAE